MLIEQTVGVCFTDNNTFRNLGYMQIFRTLNPNAIIEVVSSLDYDVVNNYHRVYVICDYIYYASRCVSRKIYPKLFFILDECRKGVVSPLLKTIHPRSIDDFFYGRRGVRGGCIHCKVVSSMTTQEMQFIHLSSGGHASDTNYRNDIVYAMDINVKIYSRIKTSIKRKLKINSDYSLFLWCSAFVNNHSNVNCIY